MGYWNLQASLHLKENRILRQELPAGESQPLWLALPAARQHSEKQWMRLATFGEIAHPLPDCSPIKTTQQPLRSPG